jgi:hypothetical protein
LQRRRRSDAMVILAAIATAQLSVLGVWASKLPGESPSTGILRQAESRQVVQNTADKAASDRGTPAKTVGERAVPPPPPPPPPVPPPPAPSSARSAPEGRVRKNFSPSPTSTNSSLLDAAKHASLGPGFSDLYGTAAGADAAIAGSATRLESGPAASKTMVSAGWAHRLHSVQRRSGDVAEIRDRYVQRTAHNGLVKAHLHQRPTSHHVQRTALPERGSKHPDLPSSAEEALEINEADAPSQPGHRRTACSSYCSAEVGHTPPLYARPRC